MYTQRVLNTLFALQLSLVADLFIFTFRTFLQPASEKLVLLNSFLNIPANI